MGCLLVGTSAALTLGGAALIRSDGRLDRAHATAAGRLVETRRLSKGGRVGVYAYVADGARRTVEGDPDGDPDPTVEYLPDDPSVARLRRDAGSDRRTGWVMVALGVASFLADAAFLGFLRRDGQRVDRRAHAGRRLR